MGTIRAVTDADLSRADQAQLKASLVRWKIDGQDNPLIPCDVDVDGDGTADAYGLVNDVLVYITGVTIGTTVYEADGSGVEQVG